MVFSKSWRQDDHEYGHENLAQNGHAPEPEGHNRKRFLSELLRGVRAFGMQQAGKCGNKRGVKRAFPKEPPRPDWVAVWSDLTPVNSWAMFARDRSDALLSAGDRSVAIRRLH